jgi:hypothetical protein
MQTVDNTRLLDRIIQRWTRLIFGKRDTYVRDDNDPRQEAPALSRSASDGGRSSAGPPKPQRLGAVLTAAEPE